MSLWEMSLCVGYNDTLAGVTRNVFSKIFVGYENDRVRFKAVHNRFGITRGAAYV